MEIACDESGYEGGKLVGGVTDVFAHASVALDPVAAAGCVAELRRRIRSPALEYKANHLLRAKHRPVLLWLLGPEGPLLGHARVQLVDKTAYLRGLLDGPVPDAQLAAANDRLRVGDPARLDLLVPAIARAVAHWGPPVTVVHDRQPALAGVRIPGATLVLVASHADPRVQVADFLAGVARRAASEQLAGRVDGPLLALLAPYVLPPCREPGGVSTEEIDVARG